MEIHHGKHHQTYIDKLNAALSDHTDLKRQAIEDLSGIVGSCPTVYEERFETMEAGTTITPFFGNASLLPVEVSRPVHLAEAISSSFGQPGCPQRCSLPRRPSLDLAQAGRG